MVRVSDEMLMAYADGVLTEDDTLRLEALLATDAELKARLAPFVVTRDVLGSLFEQPMREPIPDHLVEFVRRTKPATIGRSAASSAALQDRMRDALEAMRSVLTPQGWLVPAGVSAVALVLIGVTAGRMTVPEHISSDAYIEITKDGKRAVGALQTALETHRSRDPATAYTSGVIPLNTFVSNDGRFCRQYQSGTGSRESFAGLACRTDHGTWQILAHAEADAGAAAAPGKEHGTASGPTRRLEIPAVESAVDQAIASDVLNPETDEAALIKQGWRTDNR